jgi:hypothetical protein
MMALVARCPHMGGAANGGVPGRPNPAGPGRTAHTWREDATGRRPGGQS